MQAKRRYIVAVVKLSSLEPSAFEISGLWAQWVSAGAAVAAVVVAALFGALTLANTRKSNDAQQRASLALDTSPDLVATFERGLRDGPTVEWEVEKGPKPNLWLLMHTGNATAYDVFFYGATDQDQARMYADSSAFASVEPGTSIPFRIRTFWGAAAVPTLIVEWAYAEGSDERYKERLPIA